MSDILLDVVHVGKRYTTYASNLQRFANWFGAGIKPSAEFWAVSDISFQVRRGESIALIGQNGAGKSSLLKLITGTVRPSTGSVAVAGSVSAILELGLGFNPEFTGRENAFHAGGLMGISQAELATLMPQIESFAEIGAFFDQPFRVYSSGMQARLAFALATARRPDLLIVDEVLSVGDSYFQHKSFDRIRQFREQGTSIVIVSHAMGDVRALADRVILLDKGKVLKDGAPDEVVDFYNALVAAKENADLTVEQRRDQQGWLHTKSGNTGATIRDANLVDAVSGEIVGAAVVGQRLKIRIEAAANSAVPRLVLGVLIRDRTGHVVWGANTHYSEQIELELAAGEKVDYEVEFVCSLGPGSYGIACALTDGPDHLNVNYEWQDNLIVFDVINVGRFGFVGTTALEHSFTVRRAIA
ncbi:ABC transporter ATP-binding protein [Aurantimonas endophytica]|uniref:Lipopolysaccharide transport system ATP-binding protein n=1 Tax=Aurantimonas endophytica TaxID=1522175 RepID=A0A7W6HDP1_9HYPH|nr:ABC transporter ATP-binding protein [Aurantimonas endophytica]MBB4003073.1 lipopolysaccharide transport system ATP-binding protein [Aurantimonas endophytica]MCO6403944.1 ATP-binding cassette domain-containing protein [Aurantimonas endophytica]